MGYVFYESLEGLTNTKEVREITENFEKNKSLDYLGRELTKIAEMLNTPANAVWIQWAHELNRKEYGDNGYQCEEKKSGKVSCFECNFYNIKSGGSLDGICLENTTPTAIERLRNPEHKPPHYSSIKRIVIPLNDGFITGRAKA